MNISFKDETGKCGSSNTNLLLLWNIQMRKGKLTNCGQNCCKLAAMMMNFILFSSCEVVLGDAQSILPATRM